MLQKLLVASVIFLALSTSSVFAQDATDSADTPSSTSDSVRETFIQRREEARNQATESNIQLRQELAERRQEFQQRAASIADAQRRAAIERIDNKLQLANEAITSQLSNVLNKLDRILERIELRKDGLEANGTDVTQLTTAIQTARQAIDDAQVQVEEQADNEYIINITTDAALRSDAQQTIQTFRTDINTVRNEVLGAKDVVLQAARVASSLN